MLLIMGDSGCGKSLMLKKIQYDMLKEKNNYFPVYIYLAEFLSNI